MTLRKAIFIKEIFINFSFAEMLEGVMKEAYTAGSRETMRTAARKFYVYASGLHDKERFE